MQYDLTLSPGGAQQIDAVGSFIKLKSALGMVRVTTDVGDYIDLTPGQGIRLDKPFARLNVKDRSGNSNSGVLLAGAFEFSDDSITGTVSVIDGGKNNTLANNCFLGQLQATSVAANYSFVSLVNPDNSGKNAIVEAIYVSNATGANGFSLFGTGDIAGLATTQAVNGTGQGQTKNVGSGSPKSRCTLRAAYIPNSVLGAPMFSVANPVNQTFILKPAEPLIVSPGNNLSVFSPVFAQTMNVSFEWREDML